RVLRNARRSGHEHWRGKARRHLSESQKPLLDRSPPLNKTIILIRASGDRRRARRSPDVPRERSEPEAVLPVRTREFAEYTCMPKEGSSAATLGSGAISVYL